MAYIKLPDNAAGMRGLMAFRPHLAPHLGAFTEGILCIEDGLTKAEREIIGTLVSKLNDCQLCEGVHGAVAACYLDDNEVLIEQIKEDYKKAPISDKLKALLNIATSVQKGGKYVSESQIQRARDLGATDIEIHDTVIIAATFCFFNRYLDGLGIDPIQDSEIFRQRGRMIAKGLGYAPKK
ncbi:carboxymuconolactone decarboxylase family protein [Emticicia sp. BO119]|uniref:carboxymuconolactone decarboxylase family protein n=1 Tax=Emticicia sp. BO119 TaxID=2757768 RepID=UPI0015EFF73F|nr:peroxidase-related enzyme [Emticicia sp. BO119]MBA4853159.1 peroxidase-related enzyme [Emticicia sp. BO119]